MLHDSFTDLECQVQPWKVQVALLEPLDNVKRMQVVIEPVAMGAHQFVKLAFASVSERRVADVMHQCQRLRKIGIESERSRDDSCNLGDFQRVCQTIAKVIGIPCGKDLRFCFQAPKSLRVDHTVAVPRINVSVGMRRLRIATPGRLRRIHGIGNPRHILILCHPCRNAKRSRLRHGYTCPRTTISPPNALC